MTNTRKEPREQRREVTAACRAIAAAAMAVGLRAWDLDRLSGEEMPHPCGTHVARLCAAAEQLLEAFDRLDEALDLTPQSGTDLTPQPPLPQEWGSRSATEGGEPEARVAHEARRPATDTRVEPGRGE